MSNILIVSGHTNLNESIANKTILEELSKKLSEAEFDYLDKLYPDYKINVEAEQKKLLSADVIVLQFPYFWYAMPSLMGKWMEDVFEYGFSHGTEDAKLRGKKLVVSFTTGAPEALYQHDALMGYEVEEYLAPLKSTCALCGMEFAGVIYTCGVSYQSRTDTDALVAMKERATAHADRVVQFVKTL